METAIGVISALLYWTVTNVAARHIVAGGVRRNVRQRILPIARLDLGSLNLLACPEAVDLHARVLRTYDWVDRPPSRHQNAIREKVFGPAISSTLSDLRLLRAAMKALIEFAPRDRLEGLAARRLVQLRWFDSSQVDGYTLRLIRTRKASSEIREVAIMASIDVDRYEFGPLVDDLISARLAVLVLALGISSNVVLMLVAGVADTLLLGAVSALLTALATARGFGRFRASFLSVLVGPPLGALAATIAATAVVDRIVTILGVSFRLQPIPAVLLGIAAGVVGARFCRR